VPALQVAPFGEVPLDQEIEIIGEHHAKTPEYAFSGLSNVPRQPPQPRPLRSSP
jgi:hypothetical protein